MKKDSVIPYTYVFIDNCNGRMEIYGDKNITPKKAEQFIGDMMKSFETGGCNASISESLGYIPYPKKVIFMKHDTILYEWVAPMFMVW